MAGRHWQAAASLLWNIKANDKQAQQQAQGWTTDTCLQPSALGRMLEL
jgi:hypothetical protein